MKILHYALAFGLVCSQGLMAEEDPVVRRECSGGTVYKDLLCQYENLHDELSGFPQFSTYKEEKAVECPNVQKIITENKELKKEIAKLKKSSKKKK